MPLGEARVSLAQSPCWPSPERQERRLQDDARRSGRTFSERRCPSASIRARVPGDVRALMSDHLWRFMLVPFVATDNTKRSACGSASLRRKLIPTNPPSSFGERVRNRPQGRFQCLWPALSRQSARSSVKTKITLTIDTELLQAARAVAAEKGCPLSALLIDQLAAIVLERRGFEQARKRALARLHTGIALRWTPARSRHDVHER